MKVEKIEIKKTLMDIPEGRQWIEYYREPLSVQMLTEGEVPPYSTVSGGFNRYEVEIVGYSHEPPIKYLVKVDDRKLFQDLIKISDASFNRAVEKKTDWYRDWMVRELEVQRWKIINLPWWKRLFKRF